MYSKVYRWCAVPQCHNTSIKTPDKLFVFVPQKKTIRDKWLKLARRDKTAILPSTHLYFCEDHFDMPNDMENYMEYHLMGSVSQIRMKPGCMPTRYQCQSDRRKRTSDVIERSYILKKQRKTLIEECEKDLEERAVVKKQVELGETSSRSSVALNQDPETGKQPQASKCPPSGTQPVLKDCRVRPERVAVTQDPVPAKTSKQKPTPKSARIKDQPWLKVCQVRQTDIVCRKPQKEHVCDICQKKFATKVNLTGHMRIHNDEKPYACGLCEQRFRTSSAFSQHKRTHTQQRDHVCDVCKKEFSNKKFFNAHMRTHSERFVCGACSLRFSTRGGLDEHKATHSQDCDVTKVNNGPVPHTDQKPYVCDTCSQRFATRTSLYGHMSTHSQKSDYICSTCKKKFTSKKFLNAHIRTHAGETLYACDACAQRFTTRTGLLEHNKAAHTQKNYVCETCKKEFTLKASLGAHRRTHTGEKPHACDACAQRFTAVSALNQHKRTHLQNKA